MNNSNHCKCCRNNESHTINVNNEQRCYAQLHSPVNYIKNSDVRVCGRFFCLFFQFFKYLIRRLKKFYSRVFRINAYIRLSLRMFINKFFEISPMTIFNNIVIITFKCKYVLWPVSKSFLKKIKRC